LDSGEQDILKALKDNLQVAQNQQKTYADRHRVERTFEVGDLVFLRLQPYRQSSLKKSGVEKLKPHFYGPYRVVQRIGEVAYELELPRGVKFTMCFMFHASRRHWDNMSLLRQSYLHWMRRGSWCWFLRRY
jgi:hypothetical protein